MTQRISWLQEKLRTVRRKLSRRGTKERREREQPVSKQPKTKDATVLKTSPVTALDVAKEPATVIQAGCSASGCKWSDCEGSEFKVRAGPDYKQTGKKVPSKDPFYRQVGVDVFRNTIDGRSKVEHVAQHVRLPAAGVKGYEKTAKTRCPLPRLVICNCQAPTIGPKLFGTPAEDAGVSIVQYFEIKQETVDLVNKGEASKNKALALLIKFFQTCQTDNDMRRRFKAIGIVDNMAQVGVPSMLRGYNGKPVIIFKTGTLYSGAVESSNGNQNDWYFEIDINVHEFNYLAKKGFCTLQDKAPQMMLKNAFVIQGESEDELDEQVFACSRTNNLDLAKAVEVKFRTSHPNDGGSGLVKSFSTA